MKIRALSIRAKLVLASALTVAVAMILLASANILSAQATVKDLVSSQTSSLVKSNAREVESWARDKTDILTSLTPVALSDSVIPSLVQARAAGRFARTYVGRADKKMITDEPLNLPADYDPTTRPWYATAARLRHPILTEPYLDASNGSLVLSVAVPIDKDGKTQAVIAGDIGLDDIIASTRALRPTENSFAYLVAGDGKIIAHPDPQLTLKPATDVFPRYGVQRLQALAQNPSELGETVKAGPHYWMSAVPIKGTNWTLVVALSQDDILAGVRQMRTQAIVTGVVMILLAAAALAALTRVLLRRLGSLKDALQDIASGEGDLTRRLDQTGHDELAQVGASFNQFVEKIAATLRRIRQTTESVNIASDEIAAGNSDLARRTEGAAASLQETSSSMEELSSTVKQTADAGNAAVALATSARDAANHGGTLMTQVVETMQAINENAGRIGDIIGVIDSIAFQTNILALNAAVEAARAGEHGKGFAVVASEVRALAQRSAQSAREIKALIGTNVEQVSRGGDQVRQAGEAMDKIVSEVQRVTDIINEIKVATGEQSLGINQIEIAVQQLDGSTQQNAALVQESSAAADSLRDQAQVLAQAVAGFKLDGADHVQPGGPGVAVRASRALPAPQY
ncbi:methyl-accepting chemotaxis protein [Castellaniella caeni]|uniref:methyl-accepting chemotaxis protein n=1 Tax=Castellaniella caeni TaxID=266123 RepID=UPI000830B5C5|nr:methyl-accepting chemotaxis protein [Castellaniella caeni]